MVNNEEGQWNWRTRTADGFLPELNNNGGA